MIGCIAAVLNENPELFNSPRLLRELRTFVRQADGRDSAALGAHDDCVMAMGIALMAREELAAEKSADIDWASFAVGGAVQ